MTFWIIEPRDPLIVRDGRPFGPNPGARAATLPFPFPSTVVGALRHKAGLQDANGIFNRAKIKDILAMPMRGPLLVELDDADTVCDWLLPAPADALLLDPDPKVVGAVVRRWLAPRSSQAETNQPDGLSLVGPSQRESNKVSGDAPRFWYQQALWHWLSGPRDDQHPYSIAELGIRGLEVHSRMHVSIQPDQQTAREGALFQTSGLEFAWRDQESAKQDVFATKRLALAVWFDGDTPYFNGGFAPLGGERRLMRWHQFDTNNFPFDDKQRDDIFAQIEQDRQCRVLLITPALFQDGFRPQLNWVRGGVQATLKAAAVPRMQTISGWDLTHRNDNGSYGRPKPTRRLAPAGSVYFIEFPDGADVRKWLTATWMKNVSDAKRNAIAGDNELASHDGFGLAVIGTWPKE